METFAVIIKTTNLVEQQDGCGACTACCTVLGVNSIGKAPHTPCEHLIQIGRVFPGQRPYGCSVYHERPRECKHFQCAYLMGCFGNQVPQYRPDKMGLMIQAPHASSPLADSLICWELRPDACDTGVGKEFLDELTKRCLVFIIFHKKSSDLTTGTRKWTMAGPEQLLDNKMVWFSQVNYKRFLKLLRRHGLAADPSVNFQVVSHQFDKEGHVEKAFVSREAYDEEVPNG